MNDTHALAALTIAVAYLVAMVRHRWVDKILAFVVAGCVLGPWGLALIDPATQPVLRDLSLVALGPLVLDLGARLGPPSTWTRGILTGVLTALPIGAVLLVTTLPPPGVVVAMGVGAGAVLCDRPRGARDTNHARAAQTAFGVILAAGAVIWIRATRTDIVLLRLGIELFVLPLLLAVPLTLLVGRRRTPFSYQEGLLLVAVLVAAGLADALGATGLLALLVVGAAVAARGGRDRLHEATAPLGEAVALLAVLVLVAALPGRSLWSVLLIASLAVVARLLGTVLAHSVILAPRAAGEPSAPMLGLITPPVVALGLAALAVVTAAAEAPRIASGVAAAALGFTLPAEMVLAVLARSRPKLATQLEAEDRIGDRVGSPDRPSPDDPPPPAAGLPARNGHPRQGV